MLGSCKTFLTAGSEHHGQTEVEDNLSVHCGENSGKFEAIGVLTNGTKYPFNTWSHPIIFHQPGAKEAELDVLESCKKMVI
jgi:hypothetical protein